MPRFLFVFICLSFAVFCGVFVLTGRQAVAQNADISAEQLLAVKGGVSGALHAALGQSRMRNQLRAAASIQNFYAVRGFEPYWTGQNRVYSQGRDFAKILEDSWKHGFNPHSYHLENILHLLQVRDEAGLAQLDILLTDAYVRMGQDLSGIRVDPRSLWSDKKFWQAPLTSDSLLQSLSQSRDIQELMAALEPRSQTYKRIQQELMNLVQSPPKPYESVLPLELRGLLYPAQRSKIVPGLRVRLGVQGPQTEDDLLYDDRLAAAVIRFQRENGLKDDGVIGPQTLDILNVSRDQKIYQLVANLERLRWVEDEKPDTFVVVNIPSARLWAVEDGRVQFEMPVIVGRKKRPTNIFRAEIHGVRLNPDWTVPPTIKRHDIVPKMIEDPEYMTNKGMQLIRGRGEEAVTLDPATVDWENMTEEDLKSLTMVQIPGAHNPLGRIRVLMPNSYNIYLHDTNEPEYFGRASRAASSGCVRMSEPEKMANFILKYRKNWGEGSLDEYLQNPKTRDLFIPEPIPVYMLYYTVWINDQGALVYGHDLYDFDASLIKMLKDIDGIFIPVDNT